MSPLAILFACLGVVTAALGLVVPALMVVIASVRKLGMLEGVVTSSITELRKSVEDLRDGLKQLTKIPELERRVTTLEDSVSKFREKLESTAAFKAVTKEQIETFKREKSSPDLSRFVPPPLPRKDP